MSEQRVGGVRAERLVRACGRAFGLACAWTSLGLASALIGGCSQGNPFRAREGDYAQKVAVERLRSIPASGIESSRRVAPPTKDPAAAITASTPTMEAYAAAKARFAAMATTDLTVEQARASALANNLDLKVAFANPTIDQQRVYEEDARFEKAFTLRTDWRQNDTPTASTLVSGQSETQSIEPGVKIPLRTGGTATVSLPVQRNQNDNSFSTLNPAYTSDLQFSLSQPLLRNAGRRANTAQLKIAGINQQVSQAQTSLEVVRQLAAADRSYWRLYQARKELEVSQTQYELAQAQLERAERRVRAGLVQEVEVTRAQAGLAERLEAIITAQNNVLLQQRELKRIINLPGLSIDTPTMIVPSSPPDPVEYAFETGELVKQALGNRMEMLALELQLAADAVTIDFNRNQKLPLLTLDYTYRVNGLGGSTQDSFHTLQRNNFADWSVGLAAEVPLGNEAAEATLRQSILQRIQRLDSKQAREQAITQEVLNAVDTLAATYQRILAARQSAVLAGRTLAAEQRQFEVGNRTSTDVLDAASRLRESQLSEVRALTDYQVAQVDLAFATGTLLGASKVAWEPTAEEVAGEGAGLERAR